jgi:glycyl-tRNA synthetase beta chain
MPELLIELFCEEIPARMQARGAEDFLRLMAEACAADGLTLENPIPHHGPRRITLVAQAPAATEAVREERRGPRADAPARALEGFLAANGVTLDVLERRDTGKGVYYFLNVERPGRIAAEVIGAALPAVLRKLPWPKSMRWGGAGDFTFARPLRRILCLFDGSVVRLAEPVAGLGATNITEGHRFLAPAPFPVAHFSDYMRRLREACVVVDAAERRRLILEGARAAAQDAGLALFEDEGLLDEVTGLVEWPCPSLGRIDTEFMDLPPEVLRTSMRVNQRYFATTHPDGTPAPHFVVIANIPGNDGGAAIIAGNERVLRARFSDARFFWDSDRRQPLEANLPKLESVIFHARLGTQAQRVARLEALAEKIAPLVGADPALARRAARLAKADLATGMVGEFPELQGVMGSYYARAGEGGAVADAIRDHYAPRGPNDAVPTAPVTVAVALADKLDQLAGFFAVGEKPTGSGDPFGLRRAALGVIRLVRENGLRLDLADALEIATAEVDRTRRQHARDEKARAAEQARKAGLDLGAQSEAYGITRGNLRGSSRMVRQETLEILDFLADRLRVQLRAEGKRHDIVAAILARGTDPDLVRLLARAEALETLLGTEDGTNLLVAYRRAANILRIEEKRDSRTFDGAVDDARLTDPAERALNAALAEADATISPAIQAENFAGAMAAMAKLRHPIDIFFEQVTVNAPEKSLRENRLNLLARLRATFDQVADFSRIEG